MKKVMLAFCLICGGIVAFAQQDTTSATPQTNQYNTMHQDDREKINSRDLPDGVKRSLEGQNFRGWLVNAAYRSKAASDQADLRSGQSDTTSVSGHTSGAYAQEVFVVELKNGAQTKTVRFDKDGKKLDDQGLENDQNKK